MSDPRTLRSKRLRAALFAAAGGCCQMCGRELEAGWHADHVVPWVVSGRTNVNEMQALCAGCNLQKGAMMKTLRRNQILLQQRAQDIVGGRVKERRTTAVVTPGGGKSLAAAIFAASLLDGDVIDYVAWICPRTSLALQAADGFRDPYFNPDYSARRADNTPPLIRDADIGRVAYTTTYQSVAACADLHRDTLQRDRFLLILDEPHHMADNEDRTWVRAVSPLVDLARHTLLMTGTVERHDGAPVPFLNYKEADDGRMYVVPDVKYSRREALAERAILPIQFTYVDGWVRYLEGGHERAVDISHASDEEAARVIQTFLGQPSYRDALVRRAITHWLSYSANVYPSRAIVVCASQMMARQVAEMIKKTYEVQVALAISDDIDSQHTIKQFRNGTRGKVLVTVGMAYEGLDVPDVTHLVCLTATRSVPWLEQAFARATRVDYKALGDGVSYERQHAHIFVPDDPKMRAVVEAMKTEQEQGVSQPFDIDGDGRETTESHEPRKAREFVGLAAAPGAVTFGTIEERMSRQHAQIIDKVQAQIPGLSHVPANDILRAIQIGLAQATQAQADEPVREYQPLDEPQYRKAIEAQSRSRDAELGLEPGSTNRLLRRVFGKSREEMGVGELRKVLLHLQQIGSAT